VDLGVASDPIFQSAIEKASPTGIKFPEVNVLTLASLADGDDKKGCRMDRPLDLCCSEEREGDCLVPSGYASVQCSRNGRQGLKYCPIER